MKTLLVSVLSLLSLSLPALAQAPKPPAPDLYALYCWSDGYLKYAADVQKVGIRWLRVGGWQAGAAGTEKAMLLASQNGAQFVPVLAVAGVGHGKTMDANDAARQMREVARDNVQRYGPGGEFWKEHKEANAASAIRYWEIWNEPNIEFLTPPDDPNGMLRTEFYAMLLKAAGEEIHKLDPGACVIAFNTAGGAWDVDRALKPDSMFQKLKYIGWRKFIKDVVALTGPDCFDAVGLHPYTQPRSPESGALLTGLEKLRETAKEGKFDAKPVWFTEVGYAVVYPRGGNVRDERQQAAFTTRLFALAAAHGVTQVQIMYIEDIVYGPDNTQRSFGFFTAPGKWREQATATKVMKRLITDPRKAEALSEKGGGVYSYRFKAFRFDKSGETGAADTALMAWTDGNEPATYEVTVDRITKVTDLLALSGALQVHEGGFVTVVDMLGQCSSAKIENDKVKVVLTEAPIYLVPAPKEEVEKLLKD